MVAHRPIERGYHCFEYEGGGLRARIWQGDGVVCAHCMKNVNDFSTKESAPISCDDVHAYSWESRSASSPPKMAPATSISSSTAWAIIGYTQEQPLDLCPEVTLDGAACAGPIDWECAEQTGGARDELVIHVSKYDCGNVNTNTRLSNHSSSSIEDERS